MKKLLNYIPVLGVAMAFAACESDLDGVTYNSETAQAAVLDTPTTTDYVLNAANANDVALTLTWAKADFGYSAISTTNIDFDLAGQNFAHARQLAAVTTATEQSITVNDLNAAVINLLNDYGIEEDYSPRDYEIRLASHISQAADTLYSNVITLNITPYSMDVQYPKLWVVGKYCDWNHANSQFLYSVNFDDNYAGMIYFNGLADTEGWKITPAGDWSNGEWGMGEAPEAEAPTQTLVTSGGANITSYSHNSYYIEFNSTSGELKVSQAYDSWGIVGNHNNWGNTNEDGSVTPDTQMTLGSETDEAGSMQHFLTATLHMDAGNTWKIRPNDTWSDDKGPGQLTYEGDVADNGDGNFIANEADEYTIKWYFNKVEPYIVVTRN